MRVRIRARVRGRGGRIKVRNKDLKIFQLCHRKYWVNWNYPLVVKVRVRGEVRA